MGPHNKEDVEVLKCPYEEPSSVPDVAKWALRKLNPSVFVISLIASWVIMNISDIIKPARIPLHH